VLKNKTETDVIKLFLQLKIRHIWAILYKDEHSSARN